MTIGIYCLRFEGTDKVYVGQSNNIERRFRDHKCLFKNLSHAEKLQEAYNIFGMPSIEILVECSEEELYDTEKEAIIIFNAVDAGFNSCISAGGSNNTCIGELNKRAKYTNEQYISVFNALIEHRGVKTHLEISNMLGISVYVIDTISSGVGHTWLQKLFPEKYKTLMSYNNKPIGEKHRNALYTKDKYIEIFRALIYNSFKSHLELSKILNVSVQVIDTISSGTRHGWIKAEFPEEYALLQEVKAKKPQKGTSARDRGIKYPAILSPDNIAYDNIENLKEFAKEHSLHGSGLSLVLRGKQKEHKGWKLA